MCCLSLKLFFVSILIVYGFALEISQCETQRTSNEHFESKTIWLRRPLLLFLMQIVSIRMRSVGFIMAIGLVRSFFTLCKQNYTD